MIPRAAITAWRARAPWATDAQVEQDLVISRALVDIYGHELLGRSLAFRGGTALHKLLLAQPGRCSEDIDLVQVEPGPIGPVLQSMRSCLGPWLGEPRWARSQGRVTFVYRFESETLPATPLRLKVEINTREHGAVLGPHHLRHAVTGSWHAGEADVLTFAPEELLATKLRALYQRAKGRDLFDLAHALEQRPDLDAKSIVGCFQSYMARDGLRVTRRQFEQNLTRKMFDAAFLMDVPPLLAPGLRYDPAGANAIVMEKLVALIS